MHRRLLLVSAVIAGPLLACGSPPEPECSPIRPCTQSGYACTDAGKCELDPGGGGGGGGLTCPESPAGNPPNLLDNPGFECGDPPSKWTPGFFGTLSKTTGRTGSAAARWTSIASPDAGTIAYYLTSDVQAPVTVGQWICAAAYVKGTGQNAIIRMRVTTTSNTSIDQQSFAQFLTTDWSRIENSTRVEPGYKSVVYGVGLRQPVAGQYIEVDDAAMWISTQPDGGCSQR